jgi:hypothetical protein
MIHRKGALCPTHSSLSSRNDSQTKPDICQRKANCQENFDDKTANLASSTVYEGALEIIKDDKRKLILVDQD